MPTVSIILPTHNGAQFIVQAVESVLAQRFSDWELIILSDGSVDDTENIVGGYAAADPRIIFVRNEVNLGIQKTLNKGITMARGKYIARIDDDDRWIDVDKLSRQVNYLENHSEYVLVGTDAVVTDPTGKKLSINTMPKDDEDIRKKMLSKNCFLHATVLLKKDVVEKVDGYRESKETLHAEDYDLWLRMGREGKMKNLAMQSTQLIARGDSLTSKNRTLQAKNIVSIIKQYKKDYPNFLHGYCVSIARYVFFSTLTVIPVPKKLVYFIQRTYRAV